MARLSTRHVLFVSTAALSAGIALSGALSACGIQSSEFDGDGGSSGSSGTSGTFGSSGGDEAGSSGSSGSSGFDPDAACATTDIGAERARANILFIVDRSGSMNCNPPPTTSSATCESFPVTANDGLPTKWSITKAALRSAVEAMPETNSIGLTYFNVDDDCAVQATPNVPIAQVSEAQVGLLATSLDAVTPHGFTPIVGGVTLGYQHLHASDVDGRKFLVLLTDGEETCAPDQKAGFVATTVTNAALVGIRTFVIGAPGSEENRAFLSQVAFNGQTARTPTCTHAASPADVGDCHFDLTNAGVNLATELNKALEAISREALSCEYDVPKPDGGTVDYGKVNVIYKPASGASETIPQDPDKACAQASGWQYTPDRKRIVLCGSACTKVKADTGGSVSIALGCATQRGPR